MVTDYPKLETLLRKLKKKNIIPNITVHQNELRDNWSFIKRLYDKKLIYGLGVSFHHSNNDFWRRVIEEFPNAVIHLIAGYHPSYIFRNLCEISAKTKILILGYKDYGRGANFAELHRDYIVDSVLHLEEWLFKTRYEVELESSTTRNAYRNIEMFNVISFDNLALKQLNVRKHISEEEWNNFYSGDDGSHTMYIDGVEKKFALNSTSDIRYNLLDNIDDMFKVIKTNKNL